MLQLQKIEGGDFLSEVFLAIKKSLLEINAEKYFNIQENDYIKLNSYESVKLIVDLEYKYDIEINDDILLALYTERICEISKTIEKIVEEKHSKNQ